MAANELLNQLSTTDASNTPAGSDVIGSSLDDELRSIKANIARSAREESTATASAAATLAVTVLNKIVPVSGSAAGSTTITLPAAATAGAGFRFTAWKTDNTNNVIIDANGAETINGGADYTMATQYEAAQFVTDGTSWVVESTAKREIGTSDLADDSVTLAKMEHGTSGDVLYYGVGGAPTRLAKGTDGQVLGLASGIPAWQADTFLTEAPATAQIMTFSADSSVTITPNVVDGMYRITGALRPSVDQFIYLQTSDDGGVNFLDTAGDTYTVAWYERSSGSAFASLDYPNEPGFRLKITGGGSTAEESAFFQALLWFNGSGRIACAVSGPSFDTSGFLYTHYANGVSQTGAPHATGINRIRIKTSTGTATGTVIVENLRLS